MSEQLSSSRTTNEKGFSEQEMTDYLDINSSTVRGLKSSVGELQKKIQENMAQYARAHNFDNEYTDRIVGSFGEKSDFGKKVAQIQDELEKEAKDLSWVEKLYDATLRDVFSQKKEKKIAVVLNPLENKGIETVQQIIDEAYYSQKLSDFRSLLLRSGKNGGLDNLDYQDFMKTLEEIDQKGVFTEDEIKGKLKILQEDHNPLFVLYEKRKSTPEAQVNFLLENEALRSGVSLSKYLREIQHVLETDSDFFPDNLSQKKFLKGKNEVLAVQKNHLAEFLRFFLKHPTLNEALRKRALYNSQKSIEKATKAYKETHDYNAEKEALESGKNRNL